MLWRIDIESILLVKYISNWHNGSSNLTEDGLTLEVHAALHYSSRLLTELTATYSVNGIFIFYYTFNYSELSVCLQMGSSTSGGLWECIEVSLSVVGHMITDHDAVYCSEFHPFISKWGLSEYGSCVLSVVRCGHLSLPIS